MPQRPLVFIESPYAGDRVANAAYLKECILDSINRGENPYASHAFFTQFLNDEIPAERHLGMFLGDQWRLRCSKSVFYMDLGMSRGMVAGLQFCILNRLATEERRIR